ncbi:hypothetical protein B0T14DRAFT_481438 [Immersiella caudata]|uniref:C2H2-type domain-containing protein n=1 Tax=Immersiella caudata TaxID=314043 RepID=A0AA40C066_9PEZI|nr:hypothetical protein B0T14DRAFT_481438 [Immersiella caudata]
MRALCQHLDSKIFQHADNNENGDPGNSSAQQEVPGSGDATTGPSALGRDYRQAERHTRGGDDGHGGDGDENDGDNRRRKLKVPAELAEERPKFACPYYKRNPRKYGKWTSCPGPGWDEVHRVKSHLYKRHALPPQCPRCWEPFRSEDAVREHLQQETACVKQENQMTLTGFTKEQERMLRSRKRVRPGTGEADKWREMYRILFPDDDIEKMPNPYYENTQDDSMARAQGIESYAVFLRREMPALVRRELESMFQNELRTVEESLRPQIEQMVIGLQPRLLRMFQQSISAEEREPDLRPDQGDAPHDDSSGDQGLAGGLEVPIFEEEPSFPLGYDELMDGIGDMEDLPLGDELVPGFDINFDGILDADCMDPSLTFLEHQS